MDIRELADKLKIDDFTPHNIEVIVHYDTEYHHAIYSVEEARLDVANRKFVIVVGTPIGVAKRGDSL